MRLLPFRKDLVRATVEMNLQFQSPSSGFTTTPDLSLILMPMSGTESSELAVIGECAFTQDKDQLEYKLRHEIEAHPEVVMVIMIIISEVKNYHSPQFETKAWKHFSKEPMCLDAKSFLTLREPALPEDSTVVTPVRVAQHVWCNISTVEYFVWVKNGGETIDITNHTPENMGYGVCNAFYSNFKSLRLMLFLFRPYFPTSTWRKSMRSSWRGC